MENAGVPDARSVFASLRSSGHVFGGVIMLAVVVYRGMAGQFSDRHHDLVEAVSLYWHFVDVVWIVLYSVLYWL